MSRISQTKSALVQKMLRAKQGASVAQICKATDWPAHTLRAFLSRLRKAGETIEREDADGGSRYRLSAEAKA